MTRSIAPPVDGWQSVASHSPNSLYRLLSVDTAYGEKQENSFSAVTAWGIWHDKEEAPRAMLTEAWRGRPRLRGIPDSPNKAERKGLVEHVYDLATRNRVDLALIEQKTRGTDLYNELERLTYECLLMCSISRR